MGGTRERDRVLDAERSRESGGRVGVLHAERGIPGRDTRGELRTADAHPGDPRGLPPSELLRDLRVSERGGEYPLRDRHLLRWNDAGVAAISDLQGNAWTLIAETPYVNDSKYANKCKIGLFSAPNCKAGANTVTIAQGGFTTSL